MKEFPLSKEYQHDTILYKKTNFLKIAVTIYAKENVYFVLVRDGNTFNYYAKENENKVSSKIIAHPQPDQEFIWDNLSTTITTNVLVYDEDTEEWVVKSTNTRETDKAIRY